MWLLILGAGDDQLDAYHEANRLGISTIGVDMRPDAPAASVATIFLPITTRDASSIAAAIGDTPINGIIAPASDAAQPALRELAFHFGLTPPVSEPAMRCSSNKGAMRRMVDSLKLPAYRWFQHHTTEALLERSDNIGFPMIVKPSDSSGSKGISYVVTAAQLPSALELARTHSVNGEIIMEEVVEGKHLSAECFFDNDNPALILISERHTTGAPDMVTVTHVAPAAISAAEQTSICTSIHTIARAIDLTSGPVNFDFVLTPDGTPYVIELGTRLGGNGMPRLVKLAFGVDTVTAAIAHACGEPFDITPRWHKSAVLHILHAPQSGIVQKFEGVELIRSLPELVDFELFVSEGSEVAPYTQAANKLGYVLMTGTDTKRLHEQVAIIEEKFEVIVRTPTTEQSGKLTCSAA